VTQIHGNSNSASSGTQLEHLQLKHPDSGSHRHSPMKRSMPDRWSANLQDIQRSDEHQIKELNRYGTDMQRHAAPSALYTQHPGQPLLTKRSE
jgi:hypothetical protein